MSSNSVRGKLALYRRCLNEGTRRKLKAVCVEGSRILTHAVERGWQPDFVLISDQAVHDKFFLF
eukprot:m.70148 g.70148  ORF g.70148 m.70148 type:complete len:64 (+) comp16819_c0_seq4:205-396(+)